LEFDPQILRAATKYRQEEVPGKLTKSIKSLNRGDTHQLIGGCPDFFPVVQVL